MRYFFDISYKGTAYHGWQRQKNAISVQEVLEDHLSTMFRTKVEITGSGRTDTGVHARQQCFHVDLEGSINPEQLRNRINSFLPNDIGVLAIQAVNDQAHARFDALSRSYEYWLIKDKDPLQFDYAYHFQNELSTAEMNLATSNLLGIHDFESFSRVKTDVKNFLCEIYQAKWIEEEKSLKFHITANRFLRGMVRAIVGTLLEIGEGNRTVGSLSEIIRSKDRKLAGRAVPSKGLYLTRVKYPESIFIK